MSTKAPKVVIVEEKAPRGFMGSAFALLGVAFSTLWLLNLTGGIIELPDNIPLIGNIDEAFAAGVLFTSLRYLGFDVLPFASRLFQREKTDEVLPRKEK